MKRLLPLLLVIAMLFGVCTVFCACHDTTVPSEKEDKDDETDSTKLNMKNVTVEKGVLYDNLDIIVTLTDMEVTQSEVIFHLEVQNTGNQTRCISAYGCIVNGVSTINSSISEHMTPQSTSAESFVLPIETLELLHVKTIGQLSFYFSVTDTYTNYLDKNVLITINTNKAGYVHTPPSDGEVLFEKDEFRIILVETVHEKDKDAGIVVYAENTTDDYLYAEFYNIEVNGWLMPRTYFSAPFPPHTNAMYLIHLPSTNQLGITNAADIQNIYYDVKVNKEDLFNVYNETHLGYLPGDPDYVAPLEIEGKILYEDEYVQMIQTGITLEDGLVTVDLYIKNFTDYYFYSSFDSVRINHENFSDDFFVKMLPGSQCLHVLKVPVNEDIASLEDIQSFTANFQVDFIDNEEGITTSIDFPLD